MKNEEVSLKMFTGCTKRKLFTKKKKKKKKIPKDITT